MNPVEITFEANDEGITPDDLKDFENSLRGLSLPQDYRNHMLTYNGGEVEQYDIVHKNYYGTGDGGISDFLPIKYGGYLLEDFNTDLATRLPTGYLAIGYTNGGGILIMSLNDNNTYGNIEVMYTEGQIKNLSPSFTDLINDMVERES